MENDDNKIVEVPFGDNGNGENALSQPVETDKMKELSEKIQEADKQLQELQDAGQMMLKEDLYIQENEWLKARLEEQRSEENRVREELYEKQRLLEERRKEQNESLAQTRQMQLYNRMHEDEQRDMVYAVHGISVDKEEGMKEYKNALYQGAQIMLYVVNIALCVYAAFAYGVASNIFFAFIALTAVAIALLPRESYGKLDAGLYASLTRILSFLPSFAMGFIIACKEFYLFPMTMVLLGAGIAAAVLCTVGALGYFVRNPYRIYRKPAREAKSDIKLLKKNAAKTVKKNQKLREKLESKLKKDKDKQENRLNRLREKEELKYIKSKQREEKRAEKLRLRLEKSAERQEKQDEINKIKEENRQKRKELNNQKLIELKSKISKTDKKAN